jgi:resuscitation-promoting factor RpfB
LVPGLLTSTSCEGGPATPPTAPLEAAVASTAPVETAAATPTGRAPSTIATPSSRPSQSVIQKRVVTETRSIAFGTRTVDDPALAEGTRVVRNRGVPGVRTLTYEVIFTNGKQTAKRLVRSVVTKAPVTRVVAVGTKTSPSCQPNYSGACVPIADDVDCAGGSGNGPAYVEGPVRITGPDVYDLDGNDNDGIGCED